MNKKLLRVQLIETWANDLWQKRERARERKKWSLVETNKVIDLPIMDY